MAKDEIYKLLLREFTSVINIESKKDGDGEFFQCHVKSTGNVELDHAKYKSIAAQSEEIGVELCLYVDDVR